jgi:hypothetical protein
LVEVPWRWIKQTGKWISDSAMTAWDRIKEIGGWAAALWDIILSVSAWVSVITAFVVGGVLVGWDLLDKESSPFRKVFPKIELTALWREIPVGEQTFLDLKVNTKQATAQYLADGLLRVSITERT